MKKFLENTWVLLVLRFIVGGIFIYAGVTKVADPLAFADSIASFQTFPAEIVNIIAMGLPVVEIILGALLILGRWSDGALLGVLVLTLIFSLSLGQAMARGIQVDCGCFGSGAPSWTKTWMSFGRALLLLVGSFWLYSRALKRRVDGVR